MVPSLRIWVAVAPASIRMPVAVNQGAVVVRSGCTTSSCEVMVPLFHSVLAPVRLAPLVSRTAVELAW